MAPPFPPSRAARLAAAALLAAAAAATAPPPPPLLSADAAVADLADASPAAVLAELAAAGLLAAPAPGDAQDGGGAATPCLDAAGVDAFRAEVDALLAAHAALFEDDCDD